MFGRGLAGASAALARSGEPRTAKTAATVSRRFMGDFLRVDCPELSEVYRARRGISSSWSEEQGGVHKRHETNEKREQQFCFRLFRVFCGLLAFTLIAVRFRLIRPFGLHTD